MELEEIDLFGDAFETIADAFETIADAFRTIPDGFGTIPDGFETISDVIDPIPEPEAAPRRGARSMPLTHAAPGCAFDALDSCRNSGCTRTCVRLGQPALPAVPAE